MQTAQVFKAINNSGKCFNGKWWMTLTVTGGAAGKETSFAYNKIPNLETVLVAYCCVQYPLQECELHIPLQYLNMQTSAIKTIPVFGHQCANESYTQ